jgi:CubicO group peptidase (beta-lactamase class C family)
MVIRNGKILVAKSYGFADVENKVPCAPDTNFRLASFTKQFTAMSVLILADQGKLSLDDPITKFFPEFPAYGSNITVRELLHHTSGLMDYEDLIPDGTTIPVVDINVLRILQHQTNTYFPPGTKFRYSNSGFSLLALIVEKVSGQTYASFLRDHIFQPLHMDHSLAYEAGISQVANRAYGYTVKNGVTQTDQSLTSSVLGDGGIYSSIDDLYHWDQALYTDKLVSKKTLRLAFTPGESTRHGDGIDYGCGWFLETDRGLKKIWHSGNTIGFSTRIERYPEKKFTVIILANRNNAPLGNLSKKIVDGYLFDAK